MRNLVIATAVSLLLSVPASAADIVTPNPTFEDGPHALQPDIVVSVPAKKTFKENHPKIYKGFKKTRTVCRFLLPIVQCAGSAAQFVSVFI